MNVLLATIVTFLLINCFFFYQLYYVDFGLLGAGFFNPIFFLPPEINYLVVILFPEIALFAIIYFIFRHFFPS
jgi:hypothetical protein